jgi:DNA-binding CsgD family transcriptional regulator
MLFPQAGYRFEDFVEATSKIRSRDHLLEVFAAAMRDQGYDRVNFSVKYDDKIPDHERRFGILSTYPDDWQRYYVERDFTKIDPVLKCAAASFRPFTWKELERILPLSKKQVRFLRLGEDAGLHNGIGIPFNGPRSQIAGVALATSERTADRTLNIDLMSAYCQQFYVVFKRIVGLPDMRFPPMVSLSPKEHEVLLWVVAGKSDDEIGDILSISGNTVNYHLRHIYQKLDVHSRVAAVATAITFGVVDL